MIYKLLTIGMSILIVIRFFSEVTQIEFIR